VDRSTSQLRRLYNAYVVDYTPEQRMRAIVGIVRMVARPEVLASLAALVAAAWLAPLVIRRRRARTRLTEESRWYDRLLTVLSPHGFTVAPGETAREFATRVAGHLRDHPVTAPATEVPLEWAEAYYESRFGGQTLSESRRNELDGRLSELRVALAQRGTRNGDSA
jgi:hypothetical protein